MGKLHFIPDEHKILPSKIIVFRMKKNVTIRTKRCRIQNPTNHSREDLEVELVENSQLILVLLSRRYLVGISRKVDHLSL